MKLIIELNNPGVFKRLVELLKSIDWLGNIRIWKKADEKSSQELVFEHSSYEPTPVTPKVDYRSFWGIIRPKMGVELIDNTISEMRED